MGPLGLSGQEGPWGALGENGERGPKGEKGHIGLMVSTVLLLKRFVTVVCLVFLLHLNVTTYSQHPRRA